MLRNKQFVEQNINYTNPVDLAHLEFYEKLCKCQNKHDLEQNLKWYDTTIHKLFVAPKLFDRFC